MCFFQDGAPFLRIWYWSTCYYRCLWCESQTNRDTSRVPAKWQGRRRTYTIWQTSEKVSPLTEIYMKWWLITLQEWKAQQAADLKSTWLTVSVLVNVRFSETIPPLSTNIKQFIIGLKEKRTWQASIFIWYLFCSFHCIKQERGNPEGNEERATEPFIAELCHVIEWHRAVLETSFAGAFASDILNI